MIKIRKSEERGHANRGWLDSYHTFSFADYMDPEQMGFRTLRVLNDDRIAPGKGFGPHAHRDMEIITYVLQGTVAHRDSMGQRRTVGRNEIQAMSAGSGIVHSEFNASPTEEVHLMQIWIEPATEDLEPSYHQFAFAPTEKKGRLRLLAAPQAGASEETAIIHQDARFYVADLGAGQTVNYSPAPGRYAWVQVVRGSVSLNGKPLKEGDGASISGEAELAFAGIETDGGEFLLFDLP